MNQTISVIVPVYNAGEFLLKCLDSLREQTYTDLEILLIDDGSTDGSGDVCDEYAEKDSRFRVIHQENQGVSGARNTGLKNAEGSYIGFVDADDWTEPEYYETLYKLITKENAETHTCPTASMCCMFFGNRPFYPSDLREEAFFGKDDVLRFSLTDRYNSLSCKLFRREVIAEKNLLFDAEICMGEDLLFICQYLAGGTMSYTPQPLYHYRQSDDSVSRADFSPRRFSLLKALDCIGELVSDQNTATKDAYQCKTAYDNLVMLIQMLISRKKLDNEKEMTKKIQGNIRRNLKVFWKSSDYTALEKWTAFFLTIWPKPIALAYKAFVLRT